MVFKSIDVQARLTNVGAGVPADAQRGNGVFYIVCILYVLCQQKKMKSFFDEARLETNAPPLYCGVVPNICDRNPILLRCYAEWNSAMRVEELSGG